MVSIVNRGLKQQATWWATTPNGTGGDNFASPVVISCRWEDRQEIFVGQIDRREQLSKAKVFTDRAVSVGDYLALGDQSATPNPTVLVDADKVKRFEKFPDLRSLEAQYVSLL